jgi:hypothetical protein
MHSDTQVLDFSVFFSGGLDSTTVAYLMARQFQGQVHLLTMNHGLGHILPGLTLRHVRDLQRGFGAHRVSHSFIHTRALFKAVLFDSWMRDWALFKSDFIWCLGCNLAWDVAMIIYNLEHQLPATFFCGTPTGESFAVINLAVTTQCRSEFFARYGISYRKPLVEWNMFKPQERAILKAAGIWPGIAFRKLAIGVQLICLPGWKHMLDFIFDIHALYPPDRVQAFITAKQPLMEALISEHFKRKGLEVGELVARLQAKKIQLGIDEKFALGDPKGLTPGFH